MLSKLLPKDLFEELKGTALGAVTVLIFGVGFLVCAVLTYVAVAPLMSASFDDFGWLGVCGAWAFALAAAAKAWRGPREKTASGTGSAGGGGALITVQRHTVVPPPPKRPGRDGGTATTGHPDPTVTSPEISIPERPARTTEVPVAKRDLPARPKPAEDEPFGWTPPALPKDPPGPGPITPEPVPARIPTPSPRVVEPPPVVQSPPVVDRPAVHSQPPAETVAPRPAAAEAVISTPVITEPVVPEPVITEPVAVQAPAPPPVPAMPTPRPDQIAPYKQLFSRAMNDERLDDAEAIVAALRHVHDEAHWCQNATQELTFARRRT